MNCAFFTVFLFTVYLFVVFVTTVLKFSNADNPPGCTIPWEHPNYRYIAFPGSCGVPDINRSRDEVVVGHEPVIPVGGRLKSDIVVEFGDYPWVARVIATFYHRVRHTCLGSLIGKKHVLTSASCIYTNDLRAQFVTVVLGDSILNARDCSMHGRCAPEPQTVNADTISIHEALPFDHNPSYDIALLKLEYDITYNGFVLPICLPYQCLDADTNTGKVFPITGYGDSEKLILANPGDDPIEWRLLETRVRGVSWEECSKRWNTFRPNTVIDRYLHICVEPVSPRGTACSRDLGGPLAHLQVNSSWLHGPSNYWLLGQLVFGATCLTVEQQQPRPRPPPLVYLNIGRHTEWIMKNLESPWHTRS